MHFASIVAAFLPLLVVVSAGTPFTLFALTKRGTVINQKPVHANNGQFWVGRPTKSSCSLAIDECPPGDETAMSIPFASMGMYVKGESQQAYIGPLGALRFTHPDSDSATPPGSITTLREVHTSGSDVLTWGGDINISGSGNDTWYACPVSGKTVGPPWKIAAPVQGATIRKECKAVWLMLEYWFESGYAAYQYI